jgi:hypothetical protein
VLLTKSYWQTHTYRLLQPFNFFVDNTIISLRITGIQNSYFRMLVNFDLHRIAGSHDAIGSKSRV